MNGACMSTGAEATTAEVEGEGHAPLPPHSEVFHEVSTTMVEDTSDGVISQFGLWFRFSTLCICVYIYIYIYMSRFIDLVVLNVQDGHATPTW